MKPNHSEKDKHNPLVVEIYDAGADLKWHKGGMWNITITGNGRQIPPEREITEHNAAVDEAFKRGMDYNQAAVLKVFEEELAPPKP